MGSVTATVPTLEPTSTLISNLPSISKSLLLLQNFTHLHPQYHVCPGASRPGPLASLPLRAHDPGLPRPGVQVRRGRRDGRRHQNPGVPFIKPAAHRPCPRGRPYRHHGVARGRDVPGRRAQAVQRHAQLYPTCPRKRSQVDQRLYFNMGTFYKRVGDCVYPVAFGKTKVIEEEKKEALKEALMWVNQMTACGYVLGGSMTIADIDFMSTMSTLEACKFMDLSPYKNLIKWTLKMKKIIPKYEENCQKGAEQFAAWFRANYAEDK